MKGLIRTKYLTYHDTAKALIGSSSIYREEVDHALEAFRGLDFGLIDGKELMDNTESLAKESGMLVGRYRSLFGITDIIHNLNYGKTIILFTHLNVGCSHYGF